MVIVDCEEEGKIMYFTVNSFVTIRWCDPTVMKIFDGSSFFTCLLLHLQPPGAAKADGLKGERLRDSSRALPE
jgi:hypothetical protein